MARRSKTSRARRAVRAATRSAKAKRNAATNLGQLTEALQNLNARGAGLGVVEEASSAAPVADAYANMAAAAGGVGTAAAEGAASKGILDRIIGATQSPAIKPIGASILGMMMAQRLLQLPEEVGGRRLRRKALQQQADLASPENLYLQAALPQAQREEEMARQALFSELTGGVVGPSLATGETSIGGR